jgi:NAD(P)-dependent dehydrogenase (short-subunit alcohol dehydrogenase family)
MTDNETNLRLDGKVAFITAGANGIGEGAAMHLARQGADIGIADIDADNGRRVAEAIRALGRKALFIQTDVLHSEQIEAAVAQTAEQFGRIDILVNNAGGVRRNDFMDQKERSWRKHIEMNFISMLAATSAAGKVMIAGGRGGTIINIASSEGLRAAPGYAVYAACKAGIVSFTRSMSLELSEHGIRVHALAPDMIDTAGLRSVSSADTPELNAARDRYIPLGRVGHMREITGLMVFLCSEMASYLTGVTIPVDGGTIASSGWTRSPVNGEWTLYHP